MHDSPVREEARKTTKLRISTAPDLHGSKLHKALHKHSPTNRIACLQFLQILEKYLGINLLYAAFWKTHPSLLDFDKCLLADWLHDLHPPWSFDFPLSWRICSWERIGSNSSNQNGCFPMRFFTLCHSQSGSPTFCSLCHTHLSASSAKQVQGDTRRSKRSPRCFFGSFSFDSLDSLGLISHFCSATAAATAAVIGVSAVFDLASCQSVHPVHPTALQQVEPISGWSTNFSGLWDLMSVSLENCLLSLVWNVLQ